jgi:N6-L-threonylcarbamoyladenine synthase
MSRGLILAIESSCDETAAAVVQRGSRTLSSVVASQIATHARYGGVVPELASREHLRAIVPAVRAALTQAGITLADLDAIAVTSGPGLAGALLVGITYAKALAFATNLPLIAVNHLEGHIHAVLLNERESSSQIALNNCHPERAPNTDCHPERAQRVEGPAVAFPHGAPEAALSLSKGLVSGIPEPADPNAEPALALVVSGGHTHLYLARPANNTWHYTLVGRTLDDAAGEAYDKVAKLLGLGYPGGPWIDALARYGNPHAVPFSFSRIKTKLHLRGEAPRTKAARTAPIANLDPRFLFSFSGIKTAVLRYVELHNLRPEAEARHKSLFMQDAAALKGRGFSRAVDSSEDSEGAGFSQCIKPEQDGGGLAPRVKPSLMPPTSLAEALALCPQPTLDLVASFQHAVVGDLMKKTFAAAESLGARRIFVTGGVAANRELRLRFTAEAARRNLRVSFPTLALSTDNAAMIAAAAWPRFLAQDFASPELTADPSLALGR